MKLSMILFLLIMISVLLFPQSFQKDAATIKAIVSGMENSWNKGDLKGFMSPYLNSDSLIFIGRVGLKQGWKSMMENYEKNYNDEKKRGKVKFEILRLEVLSKSSAFLLAKWNIEREEGNLGGHFTLLWKKISGKWLITIDHTS